MSHWSRKVRGKGPPRFPDAPAGRARVVIEGSDGAVRDAIGRMLADAGHEVVDCGGPESLRTGRCPLEQGATCPGIEAADLVVSSFPTGSPRERAILAAIRRRHPDTPLVVEAPPVTAQRFSGVLKGCVVLPRFTMEGLRRAVEEELAAPHR